MKQRGNGVHPVLVFGCITPIILALFATAFLLNFLLTLLDNPALRLAHGQEMIDALNHYEQIRTAVFRGEQPASNLELIATGVHLQQLIEWLDSRETKAFHIQPIVLQDIREYTADCSVVILQEYYGANDFGFVLEKTDGIWKARFAAPNVNAGIAGVLNLREC